MRILKTAAALALAAALSVSTGVAWAQKGGVAPPPQASSSSSGWSADGVVSQAGRWYSGGQAPANPGGYYMVANDNRGHAGYVGMGSIVTIRQCTSVNCQVDIQYGHGSNSCSGWFIVPSNLTYLGANYQRSWQRVSDQLYPRDPNRGQLRQRCTPSGGSSASNSAWNTSTVAAQAGRWFSGSQAPANPGGYYMVANTNMGHAGYVGMGSIVTIRQCTSVNCQVDIRYGWGSNSCSGWFIVPSDLTYLGANYQSTWQSVSNQMIGGDSNRSRLAQRCGGAR